MWLLLYVIAADPPGDEGLVCETRDLASAECSWKKGRDTHLKRKINHTKYTLNGRQETHYTRTTDHTIAFGARDRNVLGT